MIAVIFEVTPQAGLAPRYFELAAGLQAALAGQEGLISVERFESLARPGHFLSLSFWRDEEAVRQWRNQTAHRAAQQEGQGGLFEDYRLRVAHVVRDYGLRDRQQAPLDAPPGLRSHDVDAT